MNAKTWELARMFLLGMGVAFLGMLALRPGAGEAKAQQVSGGAANGVVVVGFSGPGQDAGIVVVNTVRETMAYYSARASQGMRLRSARYIGFDTRIFEMEGASGISLSNAEAESNKDAKRFR